MIPPAISVVIPAYNSERWIRAAIESVLEQTLAPVEILVVDDGSRDATAPVADAFAPRVRRVSQPNGGLSAARNTGFRETSGEWVLFLDSDDRLFPDALAKLAACIDDVSGVIYGFVLQRRIPATDTRIHSLPYAEGPPPLPAKNCFWWTSISTAGCALIRRSLNDAIGGFDENFRQVEDAEYWLRCGVTAPFRHCGHMVLDKTFHESSLGQRHGGSIWYRCQLQLKFLDWCESRGIDTAFLKADKQQIFDHAIMRCFRQQELAVLQPLLEAMGEDFTWTRWTARAEAVVKWRQWTNSLPERPAYCREVWKAWRTTKKENI